MIRQDSRLRGFTIVELLTVIVIIAILAAITVAAFRGLQRRANESASVTAVEAANKKLELYKITKRFYPGSLSDAEVQDYAKTTYQYTVRGDLLAYCLTATTGNASMFGSNTAPSPAKGGCPGHAVDGVQPITNYALNPSVETGLLNNGWSFTSQTGYTAAASTTQKNKGSYSAALTVSTTTALDSYLQATVAVPSAGTYYVSAYVYLTNGSNGYTTGGTCGSGSPKNNDAKWYNGTAWVSVCYNRSSLNTWQKVGTTLVAATATSFQLRFYPPVASGAVMYVDSLMVSNGSSSYADGNTSGWLWTTGTANNSTSVGQALP